MTLPVEVHRCQYEIWRALALSSLPNDTAGTYRVPGSYIRTRNARAARFHKQFSVHLSCYPTEYQAKIDKYLKKNPRPIVQIALERLVRAGYFDRAIEIKAFLREHNPNLLEDE
jgi:hypothetical protein